MSLTKKIHRFLQTTTLDTPWIWITFKPVIATSYTEAEKLHTNRPFFIVFLQTSLLESEAAPSQHPPPHHRRSLSASVLWHVPSLISVSLIAQRVACRYTASIMMANYGSFETGCLTASCVRSCTCAEWADNSQPFHRRSLLLQSCEVAKFWV